MLGNQNDLGRKRFCTKCGHQNNISQRYCIKCGKDFDPVNTRKANPVQPQAQSAQYQENPSAPIYPQPVQTQYYPPTHPQTQFSYATQYYQPSNTNRSLNRPPLTWEGPDRILPAFIYILRKPGKHVAQLLEGNNWPDATRVIFLFSLSCAVFLYHIVSIEIPFPQRQGPDDIYYGNELIFVLFFRVMIIIISLVWIFFNSFLSSSYSKFLMTNLVKDLPVDSPVRYNSIRRLKNAVAFLYYLPNLFTIILLGGYYSLIKNGFLDNTLGLNFFSTLGISLFLGSFIGALLFFKGFSEEIGHDRMENRVLLAFLPIIIPLILISKALL